MWWRNMDKSITNCFDGQDGARVRSRSDLSPFEILFGRPLNTGIGPVKLPEELESMQVERPISIAPHHRNSSESRWKGNLNKCQPLQTGPCININELTNALPCLVFARERGVCISLDHMFLELTIRQHTDYRSELRPHCCTITPTHKPLHPIRHPGCSQRVRSAASSC